MRTSLFTTVQYYLRSDKAVIFLIYEIDKTLLYTFVNFIHQRDAYIAMKVVDTHLVKINKERKKKLQYTQRIS